MTKHFEKFDAIAKRIGLHTLRAIVPFRDEKLEKAIADGDECFNTLDLKSWDEQDWYVRQLAFGVGFKSWSLSDTVCVLKHVARHYLHPVCEFCGQTTHVKLRHYHVCCPLCAEWLERENAQRVERNARDNARLSARLKEPGAWIVAGDVECVVDADGLDLAVCTTRTGLTMTVNGDVLHGFHEGHRDFDGTDLQRITRQSFIDIAGY